MLWNICYKKALISETDNEELTKNSLSIESQQHLMLQVIEKFCKGNLNIWLKKKGTLILYSNTEDFSQILTLALEPWLDANHTPEPCIIR